MRPSTFIVSLILCAIVLLAALSDFLCAPLGTASFHVAPLAETARPVLVSERAAPVGSATPAPPAVAAPAPARQEPEFPAVSEWSAGNVLVVGMDRRPDGGGAGLADSLLVLMFDREGKHAGVISIPRDLWVSIPDYGEERINVVPALAARLGQNPVKLFRRVLSDTLKLPIEHGLFVDLGVFERMVDRVSGVNVTVACPIEDVFHDARAEGGRRRLSLAQGPNTLDGATAAMFVRSRHGRSDFSRSRRQQAVLLGLRDRVLEQGGLTAVPDLLAEFESSIMTDMRRVDLLSLARRSLSLSNESLHGLVLAPPLTRAERTTDGKAVLLPELDRIQAAMSGLFSAPPPGAAEKIRCPAPDVALKLAMSKSGAADARSDTTVSRE
jgi:LCP family protein required for cell wall assembly